MKQEMPQFIGAFFIYCRGEEEIEFTQKIVHFDDFCYLKKSNLFEKTFA